MLDIKINGKEDDLSAMLVSAVRYALGRKTYMVSWTCDFIEKNLHLVTPKDMCVIIRDIQSQKDFRARLR